MDHGSIQHHDDFASHVAQDMRKELHDLRGTHRTAVRVLQKLSARRDGPNDRQVLPAQFGRKDGGLATASPGADLRRFQTESALVQEDEGGPLSDLFFPAPLPGRGPRWRCRLRCVQQPAVRAVDTRNPSA